MIDEAGRKSLRLTLAKLIALGFLLLLLNSAYIAAYAEPTIFYMGNVLLHLGLGLVLAVAFAIYSLRRRQVISRREWVMAAFFFISVACAVHLMIRGGARPYRWVLYAHIGSAFMGALWLAVHLRSRAGQPEASRAATLAWRYYTAILLLATIFPPAVLAYHYYHPSAADRIENPTIPPSSMYAEGDGSESLFFPSSATTDTKKPIPSDFFMQPEVCARCHADIYQQWFSSVHHFSSFNNQWYRKSIEYMQDVVGVRSSLWCAGCHDHAVFFSGTMQQKPIREMVHTPEAQRGLTCVSCHSIVQVKSTMGQGDFVIQYPPLHRLASSDNKFVQGLHDFLVRVDPEPHRKTFMKPLHRKNTAEFCASCHKVHLDVPVNNYRWLRGFNEYDNWQASGVSGQGARSFYYPPKAMKCADCHMPLVKSNDAGNRDGYVHSHRFPGANTALPAVNQDEEQMRVTKQFLQDKQVTVDIFAMSEPYDERRIRISETAPRAVSPADPQLASTFAIGEESESAPGRGLFLATSLKTVAPIDKVGVPVRRGDTVRIDVVVRTRKVGHFFPGGTVDAFDVWLELQAIDDRGQIIFWSGMVEDDGQGPVEKGAHFYGSRQVDGHGNPINKRNAWATRSLVYVRLIPPGAADTAHFRVRIPENCGDTIRFRAKLNYRKFAWWYTQWAFAGVRDPEHKGYAIGPSCDDGRWIFTGDVSNTSGKLKRIPDLPIVVMAEAAADLKVVDKNSSLPEMKSKSEKADLERWNDYGIGLLLQGDLKGAENAFLAVTQIDPNYADGWVNVARVRKQEGNMAAAKEPLENALRLDPGLAKANFFYAWVAKIVGNYEESLKYSRKAAEKYPRDRVVLNQLGRTLFLQRRYKEAVEEFQKTLKIDPEDLMAHYNLMLCYQGMGDQAKAEAEYQLFIRFKVDESAQFITGPYRLQHLEDNNERQPIHEHVSVRLPALAGAID